MVYPVIDDASDVIFTRVGAVYSDAVKITVRHPFANTTEGVVQVVWRQAAAALSTETDGWTDGPVVTLSNESDWTSTIKLSGLWPSTSYECE
jgi:alkaline phosphatase D